MDDANLLGALLELIDITFLTTFVVFIHVICRFDSWEICILWECV